jgi:hypothetical protein
MHPQQLFKNVHIAQGVTPENLSPQEVNNGALSPKPQTSPAGDGSGGGLHSTVPEEKLKQSLKANRDLASAGLGQESEDSRGAQQRVGGLHSKVVRHSSVEGGSAVEGTSERGRMGIESDRIRTNSRHSKLSRHSQGNILAGNIMVGEKVLDDGDQDTLLKNIFTPHGMIHQEDQAENNNFNIQIGGAQSKVLSGGPQTTLATPIISPAHGISTVFASPPNSLRPDAISPHGKPIDTEIML